MISTSTSSNAAAAAAAAAAASAAATTLLPTAQKQQQQQQQQQLPQQHDDDKKSDNNESVDVIIPISRATPSQKDDLQQYIGRRIAKEFMTQLSFDTATEETHAKSKKMIYFGTVDHISSMTDTWWIVLFDDGDEEDFDTNGIRQGLELYQKYKQVDLSPLASIILQEKEGKSTPPSTTTTTELLVGGKSDDQKIAGNIATDNEYVFFFASSNSSRKWRNTAGETTTQELVW